MIDEKAVWDDIWPVVERLISATVAEDTPTIRPLLYPNSQAADALDIFGFPAFDILLKTVLGHNRLGLTRAIEGDDGRAVFIEFAWLDPKSGSGYTGVDMVTVRLDAVRPAADWLVTEINPTNADLPLNGPHATSILAGTQALSEDGKLPSEPWVLPVAFIAGSLQLPLTPARRPTRWRSCCCPACRRECSVRFRRSTPGVSGATLWRRGARSTPPSGPGRGRRPSRSS